ncbi:MAG TPA: lysophospholipid acyltransferase family protein, partial [Solirubrobacteraceae bacterium]|nr:lysophospholipid acyltransferase family protein [Solirubrobacteraceae bacterium]
MTDLAPMREQVYSDPRPKEHFDRFHERARTREPDWVYDVVRVITSLYAYTFLRARAISSENAPGSGAVILAPNHFSFMDHFFLGASLRRKVRFMAKSQLFKPPMQWIYSHGGVFPVRRGARDEDA